MPSFPWGLRITAYLLCLDTLPSLLYMAYANVNLLQPSLIPSSAFLL